LEARVDCLWSWISLPFIVLSFLKNSADFIDSCLWSVRVFEVVSLFSLQFTVLLVYCVLCEIRLHKIFGEFVVNFTKKIWISLCVPKQSPSSCLPVPHLYFPHQIDTLPSMSYSEHNLASEVSSFTANYLSRCLPKSLMLIISIKYCPSSLHDWRLIFLLSVLLTGTS
jgi:hypothetical protein